MHFIFHETKRHLNTLYGKMDYRRRKTNDLAERTFQPKCLQREESTQFAPPGTEKGLETNRTGWGIKRGTGEKGGVSS